MAVENYFTPEFQKKKLKYEEAKIKSKKFLKLWLFLKNDSTFCIIGDITFSNIIRGTFQSCILSYKLDREYTKKGYMTETLEKSIEYVFMDFKLHRIETCIMPRNLDSINLIQKLGFQNEGLSKELLKINDKWEDHLRYSILNKNFE